MGDEVIYAELGRSLYESGRLDLLGEPTGFYSLVYPALIGWPLALWDGQTGYSAAKAFQALVMSLAAVPVYLWTRTMTTPRWALTAAALTLAIPGLAYTGLLMSEVAFYPAMTLAAWALAAAIGDPRPRTQGFALAAITLAVLTRLQALVLIPVFVTAIVLDAVLARRGWRSLRGHAPALLGLGLLTAVWAGIRFAEEAGVGSLIGAYGSAAETSYGISDAARFVAWHAADVVLLSGVAPACALGLLLVEAVRRREASPAVRAYLAVTASLVLWLVVEVGVFASRHVGRLAERDLLAAVPPLFVGLALWLQRGAPRPRLVLAAIAALIGVGLAALPVGTLVTEGALPDAFMLVPLESYRDAYPQSSLDLLVLLTAATLIAATALLPRGLLWLIPAGLIALFGAISISVTNAVVRETDRIKREQLGPEPRWIDRASPGSTAYLYHPGDVHWTIPYELAFWNRRLRAVYDLPGAQVPGPLPQAGVNVSDDGSLASVDGEPLSAEAVVSRASVALVGTPVARVPDPLVVLWRVHPPLRLSAWLTGLEIYSFVPRRRGIAVTGAIGSEARVAIYACGRGRLLLALRAPRRTNVELLRDGRVVRRVVLRPLRPWAGSVSLVPVRGGRGQCQLGIRSSGTVEALRFELDRD